MRKFALATLLFFLTSAAAMAAVAATQSLKLKDGSILFVDKDGDMKMVDRKGDPMTMKDGVPMEAEDGSVILMKNKQLYKRVPRGTLNPKFSN